MCLDTRVLVVGTTPDYIHWIDQVCPGRVLFVTDTALRRHAREPAPDTRTEVLTDLRCPEEVYRRLQAHLQQYDMRLEGITCFDCEAMSLAASLAKALGLPYPSKKAVELCRDKFRCKQVWHAAGVPCPEVQQITSMEEAVTFFQKTGGPCVLKPLTGSGSELVFLCTCPEEVRSAARAILDGLHRQRHNRLYTGFTAVMVAEANVCGPEYSCDFLPEEGHVRILRLTRKIPRQHNPFGITQGYIIPADLPSVLTQAQLQELLARAACSLGLSGVICMVDFIIGRDGPMFLEIAPRPGGDCLPQLIRHAGGMDMLGLALDVAQGRGIQDLPVQPWKQTVGLRLYAPQQGVLAHIDTRRVQDDPRIREIQLNRRPGEQVTLPPQDYDQWILGHVIFNPFPDQAIEAQCEDLLNAVHITITGVA